jgi:hypothetical protein
MCKNIQTPNLPRFLGESHRKLLEDLDTLDATRLRPRTERQGLTLLKIDLSNIRVLQVNVESVFLCCPSDDSETFFLVNKRRNAAPPSALKTASSEVDSYFRGIL